MWVITLNWDQGNPFHTGWILCIVNLHQSSRRCRVLLFSLWRMTATKGGLHNRHQERQYSNLRMPETLPFTISRKHVKWVCGKINTMSFCLLHCLSVRLFINYRLSPVACSVEGLLWLRLGSQRLAALCQMAYESFRLPVNQLFILAKEQTLS